MEREIFTQSELTGQAQNAYSRGGGNIMAEASGEISKTSNTASHKTPSTGSEARVLHSGVFSDSDIRDSHTRETLDLITELKDAPESLRTAASDKLAEGIGLDLDEAGKRIKEIRDELPAKGNSEAVAQLENERDESSTADGAPVHESNDGNNGAPVPPQDPAESATDIPGYVEKTHRKKDTSRPEDVADHLEEVKARAGSKNKPPADQSPPSPEQGEGSQKSTEGKSGSEKQAKNIRLAGDPEIYLEYKDLSDQISRLEELLANPAAGRADEEVSQLKNSLDQLKNKQAAVVKKYVTLLPVNASRLDELDVELVCHNRESLEYVLNEILTLPLDAETTEFQLELTSRENLNSIISHLKKESIGNNEKKDQYDRALAFQTGIKWVHDMYVQINTANLQGFSGVANKIMPQHLQILQDAKGAGMVMRLFDDEFRMLLAKDGAINNDNFFDLMGIRKPGDKRLVREDGIIFKKVKEYFEIQKASGNSEFKDIQDWEVLWAYNAGKIMYNISLRAAEMISLSENAPGDKKFASFPQESLARIMNWMGQLGLRFELAEIRGGLEFAKMAQQNYQDQREEDGFGKLNLKKIGGKKIEDFELPGMFGVSGLWSGWRQGLVVLGTLPWEVKDEKGNISQSNLKDYFISLGDKAKDPNTLLSIFLDNGELRNEFNSSLGMLLTQGLLLPDHKTDSKNKGLAEAKEKIRQAIWEKVAKDNPLAMVSFLHNMEYSNGTKVEILNNPLWEGLHSKLFQLHEIRMDKLRNGEGSVNSYISLNDLINLENQREGGIKLTNEEKKLLSEIQKQGISASKEFTHIRFPFTPFINDTLFEKADYSKAGSEFIRRRLASDIPALNNAEEGMSKLMNNPGGIEPEEALKILHEMVEALGSPLSTEVGQNKVFVFLTAYARFIERGGNSNNPIIRGFRSWNVGNGIIHGILHRPNSIAQKYAGLDAPAFDKLALVDFAQKARKEGVLSGELVKKFKKKFGAGLFGLLRLMFKNLTPVVILAAAGSTYKEISKDVAKDI